MITRAQAKCNTLELGQTATPRDGKRQGNCRRQTVENRRR